MSMGHRNLAAGFVLLAVGIGFAFATGQLPDRTLPDTPGPAFFPWLIAFGLIGLSAALIVHGLITTRQRGEVFSGYRLPVRGWLALGGFAAYLSLLPYAGFVLASVPFCGGLVALYGERRWVIALAAAILIPVLLFVLFSAGFQVLLPRGVWQ